MHNVPKDPAKHRRPGKRALLADGAAAMGIGELARRILVHERAELIPPLAAAFGLTPARLLGRLRRDSRLRPDELTILFREVPDRRLVHWLFARSGLLVLAFPAAGRDGADDTLTPVLNGATACLNALTDLTLALESRWSGVEADLQSHLDVAQSELLRLRLQIVPDLARGSCRIPGEKTEFAALVRQTLLEEQRIRLADLAEALGLRYSTLHSRVTNRTAFSPKELKRLFQLYPEPRLADYLLAGTRYVSIPKPAVYEAEAGYSPLRAGLGSLGEMLRLMRMLSYIRSSDAPLEPEIILRHVDQSLRQLALLQWNTTHIGHGARIARPTRAHLSREISDGSPARFTHKVVC